MSQPQITIIGAGLSALVFGQCLRYHGVSAVLYERDAARTFSTRHNYGMTLQPTAYRPLLPYIKFDDHGFRRSFAVDSASGGVGRLHGRSHYANSNDEDFRANRRKLEQRLSEGLDIRFEHELTDIKHEGGLNILLFRNGREVQSNVVIGADGPHSQVRKLISHTSDFKILPFVVYNGKRRVNRELWHDIFAPHLDGTVTEQRQGQTLMQVTINDETKEHVSISYTYSRPARDSDPLFIPDRSTAGATGIPNAFFEEVAGLRNLDGLFKYIFDAQAMRSDRLLNWLMRSVLVEATQLHEAAKHGTILIGDATHAGPILGGYGANQAISDAIELAEFIHEKGVYELASYYESRYERWRKYVEASEMTLADLHRETQPNL
ncbi:hypothetical protein BAUCODRAFT_38429 [Baudoinia panamericana UAMH 10762]|uniref:FAD-binding domain-containing protein n=1 Tax=Baudoinia panamericana (strain UAMH 10762) TaxID=717646 RepID=M2MLV4_BAUPA|nr:uncharacterized protein BAUCODRAFT_38429 [Baudoinia panamericana UAMH 10762]EMC92373.1 hypothetical protein BAUCODRAFT_38429 [Baudoinia panamericana UAMH 10762]